MLYFGICGLRLCRDKVVLLLLVEGKCCVGVCIYVFVFMKWKVGGFFVYFDNIRLLENDYVMGIYFD